MTERLFLVVPLGVLRKFVEENKEEDDYFLQLFELTPNHIYSESELTNEQFTLKTKSTIVIDGNNLPKHKEDKC